MSGSHEKGDRNERELVNELDAREFAVMRAPASGAATDREIPDVLAGNGESFYAIETKSSSGDPIYYDEEEVDDLIYFAKKFGAVPLLGFKFDVEYGAPAYGDDDNPGIYFVHPDDAYRTAGGNYRAHVDDIESVETSDINDL